MILDTVMGNQELDMFECRVRELESIPDLVHVIVEADVDHQDHPKPYHFTENRERFDQWSDRIHIVRATGLPSAKDFPDPWAREHAQREHTWTALRDLDAQKGTLVLHGDLDEIPTALAVRNVHPKGLLAFEQKFHCFAVDWLHPDTWRGTVAAYARNIESFSAMRDARNWAPRIPGGGWHFSWVGGDGYALEKLGSFCHPEIAERTLDGLRSDFFYREGVHVDGSKLAPVEVGRGWPKWIAARECPDSWFRPRA